MNNLESDRYLQKGRTLLSFASAELEHSEEDVVNYLVCHNTRKAISNLLRSYLVTQGQADEEVPVHLLMDQCCAADGRFTAIDLTPLECQCYTVGQNDCYCYDLEHVKECVELGWKIESLVGDLKRLDLMKAAAKHRVVSRSPLADGFL